MGVRTLEDRGGRVERPTRGGPVKDEFASTHPDVTIILMTTSSFLPLRLFLVGLLIGVVAATPGRAQEQPADVPRISDAELMFEQGVTAFEQGNFEQAAERFRLVHDYELNRKTTAAFVMEGKALLRLGRYRDAADVVSTLLDRYPQTSYEKEAERIREEADTHLEREGGRVDTLRVGVVLPMTSETVGLTQAMFNGIRLAIDEHNGLHRRYVPPPGLQASADSFGVVNTAEVYGDSLAEADGRTTVTTPTDTLRVDSLQVVTEQREQPDWVAKMYFRRVNGEDEAARAATDSLVRDDEVDVVLGPLYSSSARAAGDVAERAQVPLIAPLATERSVSEGRDYVFQTNPTIPLRGRIMARFASESLLTESVSVIYERDVSDSERMAKGFREEARQQGLQLPFTLRLDNPRQWTRLPEAIEEDTTITDSMVAETEAFYLPIAGSNASGKIQDALTGLDRLNTTARVLGNSHWHDLSVKKQASAFTATYATDFSVETGTPEVQTFIRRYRLLTGNTPDELSVRGRRLAYTGYDIAHFVFSVLSPSPPRPGPDDLRTASPHEGLGMQIHFREGNVNRAMRFHRYRNNRLEHLQ